MTYTRIKPSQMSLATKKSFQDKIMSISKDSQTDKALVTFIDDDGNSGVLTKLKPLFTSRNKPIGLALIGTSPVLNDANSIAQIKELQNIYQWEILSHTMNHINLTTTSEPDVINDFTAFANLASQHGLNVESLVYPWGQINHLSVVSRFYKSCYTTSQVLNSLNTSNYQFGRFGLGSYMPVGQDTLLFFQNKIDEAILDKKWLIFMTHCDHAGNDMQLIEDVLDYCISQGVEIVTPKTALDYYGSKFISEKLEVKRDGTIPPTKYALKYIGSSKLETDPPDARYDYRTNIFFVTDWLIGGPTAKNAVIEEDCPRANGFQIQRYRTGNKQGYRNWNGLIWSNWTHNVSGLEGVTVSVTTRELAANSITELTYYNAAFLTSYLFIASPAGSLEAGVAWNVYCHGNGAIKLNLINPTSSPITIATRNWYLKGIMY